jgi:aspartyl-tRNA(Asn)/glutamyl-tRNA(Gln) amidotransferase subunit B
MELVTEPVITSAKQTGDFARELQLVLRYLGAGEANMEKGQMRVEANISVRPEGQKEFGTKVEVKNLNSFRSVERAIDFEYCRQVKALEEGVALVQETRGWNEGKQETFSQRKKESSHDYRYFPEPDLPKLYLSKIEKFQNLKNTLPELPWEKRARYMKKEGLKAEDAEAYVADPVFSVFFDNVLEQLGHNPELAKLASNYASNDLVKALEGDYSKLDEEKTKSFVELVKMVSASEITSRGAKDLLVIIAKDGGDPRALAEEKGLLQKHDEGEIGEIVDRVISANPDIFAKFKAGDEKLLQFLIGQAMKESKGSANPAILAKIFKEKAVNF